MRNGPTSSKSPRDRKVTGTGRRKNAKLKNHTLQILPGYNKNLPPQAQELIDKALLDHNLAAAPVDNPRWTQLYEELHRLVDQTANSNTNTGQPLDQDNNANDEQDESAWYEYEWASRSPTPEPPLSANGSATMQIDTTDESAARELVSPELKQAVHRHISCSLERKNGYIRTMGDVKAESWEPSSLVAMSILVEEIAKSQASFNAQRTMFAKDPRKQALKAKKEANHDQA